MTIQFILYWLMIFEILVVYYYLFDYEINFTDQKIVVYFIILGLSISFITSTFNLKDFIITNEGIGIAYTIYKRKIVQLTFKDIKTLRFDIDNNPRRSPKLTISYLKPFPKEKVIEFIICFRYEDLVKAIEMLREKGIHVIWTENLEVK